MKKNCYVCKCNQFKLGSPYICQYIHPYLYFTAWWLAVRPFYKSVNTKGCAVLLDLVVTVQGQCDGLKHCYAMLYFLQN